MSAVPFGNYQFDIYLKGTLGEKPTLPMSCEEFEQRAKEILAPAAYDYIAGAAGAEESMRANTEAFRRWRIVPRMLRDVGSRDLSLNLLGTELAAPVLLAPVGVQEFFHPDGELATARASAATGVPMVLSSAASHSIEEVADILGDSPRWFQLYWPREPDLAASFVTRAEKAGYSAIVATLDTSILAWRPRDLRHAELPFLKAVGIANYLSDPVFRSWLDKPPEEDLPAAVARFSAVFSDPTLTWDRLSFLREHTSLPVVLKGILHPDDARRARDLGIDAVLVSNHGGRQLDGAVGALDSLPDVVAAVPDMPVLFDSGIRSGADGFKALALGATAVLLGRPFVWGLAAAGEEGVRHAILSFLAELDLTIALSGYASLAEIGPEALVTTP